MNPKPTNNDQEKRAGAVHPAILLGIAISVAVQSVVGAEAGGSGSSESSGKRPNILILMTDQQRWDSVGCYGSEAAHTPHIDQVAREGVVFEKCYVSNPVCTPSRASLLTGKTLPAHGVYQLYDVLPEDEMLFPKRLQESGYKTALFGKLHIASRLYEAKHRHPNDGFDIFEWCIEPSIHMESPHNGYIRWLKQNHRDFYEKLREQRRDLHHAPKEVHMTHWAAEGVIDLIEQSSADKPFFALMSVFDPHNPYRGYPKEYGRLIDSSKINLPLPKGESMEPEAIHRQREKDALGTGFTSQELIQMKHDYYATIALFDDEVGRVLQALEEKGVAKNTLVIICSDGGDMLGDHQLLSKGAFFYDPSVRVPLIVRWPEQLPSGRRVTSLVQLQDLCATILSAAGILTPEVQAAMPESHDLLPLMQGRVEQVRDVAVCTYRNTGILLESLYPDPPIHGTMLCDQQYKITVYMPPEGRYEPLQGQLFDLKRDPKEMTNLWDSPAYQPLRLEMLEKLLVWETRQEIQFGGRGGDRFPRPEERLDNRMKK
jgi:arylsulfatase A-like enzyme